jgi:hypothetical protein
MTRVLVTRHPARSDRDGHLHYTLLYLAFGLLSKRIQAWSAAPLQQVDHIDKKSPSGSNFKFPRMKQVGLWTAGSQGIFLLAMHMQTAVNFDN